VHSYRTEVKRLIQQLLQQYFFIDIQSNLQTQDFPVHSVAWVCTLSCDSTLGLYALSYRAFSSSKTSTIFLLLTHYIHLHHHSYPLDSLRHTYLYNPMVYRPCVDLQKVDLTYIKKGKTLFDSLTIYMLHNQNLCRFYIFMNQNLGFCPKIDPGNPMLIGP